MSRPATIFSSGRTSKPLTQNITSGTSPYYSLPWGTCRFPSTFNNRKPRKESFQLPGETPRDGYDRRNKDELVLAVIYDNEPFRVQIIENTGITRDIGVANIPLEQPEATEAHVYAFFTNADKDSFTNSRYFKVRLK